MLPGPFILAKFTGVATWVLVAVRAWQFYTKLVQNLQILADRDNRIHTHI